MPENKESDESNQTGQSANQQETDPPPPETDPHVDCGISVRDYSKYSKK